MAAARKPCSYEFNFSEKSRSLPTQTQSPRIAPPSKSPREEEKQQNIPLHHKLFAYSREEVDQHHYSSYDYYKGLSTFSFEQGSSTRIGLNKTGEEKSDQEGHHYVKKLSGLDLQQNDPLSSWAIPRSRHYRTAFQLSRLDKNSSPTTWPDRRIHWGRDSNHGDLKGRHELRSCWSPDGPGYEDVTAKAPSTITPAACLLEMEFVAEFESFFLPETRPSSPYELAVEVKGIQAGLVMVEAKTFGLNVKQRAIYQPTNNQHSGKERREKWSKHVRFRYNEAASKGVFTERPDNQIDTLFSLKKISSQGPCGSTSSAEIRESILLSHSVSEETIALYELDFFGRDWIRRWKDGPGRNKDWKSSRYLKSMRKREQAKFQVSSPGRRSYLDPSKATNCYLAITHSPPHIAVPRDMLRQKSTSYQGHSSCLKPKSSWQATNEMGLNEKTIFLPKSRTRCEPWMTDPIDSLDIEEIWRPEDRFSADPEDSNARTDDLLNAMVSTHTETSSPKFETPNAKSISLIHLLAPESFVDTVLGACLRLKRFLRTESHYELYDAEYLSDKNQKYEVRAYNLRGLSLKVRNYRVRNLKRASARSSYIDSLEQGGKKWLVFADAGADLVPEPFRDCQPLWCTKEEYDRAFPVLEPRRPYNSEYIEKEAFQDGVTVEAYDTSFEKALEGELSKLDAYQALEVINRVRERLVASSKSCHNDGTVTPVPLKQKKIKSPEEAKRLRERQRLSREQKRMAKTALRLSANGDSISQTLDMAPEPPTETSSANEINHVDADKTVAIEVQEDIKNLLLCSFCCMVMHGQWVTIRNYPYLLGFACLREVGGGHLCLRELEDVFQEQCSS